jgi:hypothetical protein
MTWVSGFNPFSKQFGYFTAAAAGACGVACIAAACQNQSERQQKCRHSRHK